MTETHGNAQNVILNPSLVTLNEVKSLRVNSVKDLSDNIRAFRVAGFALAALLFVAPLQISAASLDERLAPCLACHGEKGQSNIPEVPALGAQPGYYLSIQLYMFREKMRVVEPMNAMMKGLSDDDLQKMAAIISKLPAPRPASEPADPARLERARALV
jgi:cytochrome c553